MTALRIIVLGTCLLLASGLAPCPSAVIHIVPDQPLTLFISGGSNAPIPFDLDGNGVNDYEFRRSTVDVRAFPLGTNRVLAVGELLPSSVQNIDAGTLIGTDAPPPAVWLGSYLSGVGILTGPGFLACFSGGPIVCVGQFAAAEGYFGLEFDIGGATHYGWVRGRGEEFFQGMTLYEWAYESEPGVAILAGAIPEPSAPLLALLATLAALVRRRR